MKRIFLSLAAAALCSAAQLRAEEKQPANQNAGDSVRMYRLQEVEVTATRATPTTPVAYSDIRREEIARNSYGTDIPTLLALTPSMIATNETGIGIGGTAVRLRGTDPTRLNVTINGVAMNNPDSHSMYWYDTPDLDLGRGNAFRCSAAPASRPTAREPSAERSTCRPTPCKPSSAATRRSPTARTTPTSRPCTSPRA